jgi:DtxR family Mn-dependent transcriptional regulator
MSVSTEDYLRIIYKLGEESDFCVRSVDIATALRVTKPSVSAMVKKLTKEGYLESSPYSSITLTEEGMKKARQLMHNYRVIEVFLTKILGYDPDEIKEQAHELEHAFSQESVNRLDQLLNNPQFCPHGEEIPH